MKNLNQYFQIIFIIIVGLLIVSCGDGKEGETTEKGMIEKFSDESADKIVNELKSPIDAARNIQQKVNIETERKVKNLDNAD